MATTTCDLNVDWTTCANCARLKERIEDAAHAVEAVSAKLDRAHAEYREDVAAGRACIATPRQRAWSSYIDDLEMEQSLASSHWTESIDAWGASIHRHHRLHETRQQETTGEGEETPTVQPNDDMPCMIDVHTPCTCAMCQAEDGEPVETAEMVTARKDAAVDALVNIYGGHIDKWLEALRERTMPQPAEPTLQERDVYEQLWYGDVPELTLPKNFSEFSPMTLTYCARAIGLYMRMLKKHAPAFAEGYPSHVAHRLMDAFDETAEAREATLADGEGGER